MNAGVALVDHYPIVEATVPDEASPFAASITPGTVVLAMIAMGGVVIARLSEHRSGVSTLGPVR